MSFREWAEENGYEIKRAIREAKEKNEDPQVKIRLAYEEEKEAAEVVDKLSAKIDSKKVIELSPFEKEKARLEGLIKKYERVAQERATLQALRRRAAESEVAMSPSGDIEDLEADLQETLRGLRGAYKKAARCAALVGAKSALEALKGALDPLSRAAKAVLQPKEPNVGR